jgi:hypothetical protein
MSINFENLFFTTGHKSDDVKFVAEFAKEQQEKGKLSDEEIMRQCLEHLASQSNAQATDKIVELNKQVAKGIEALEDLGRWFNLQAVAQHALEAAITAQESDHIHMDSKAHERWVLGNKVRLVALQTGWSYFEKVFTPEFLKTNGWISSKDKQ